MPKIKRIISNRIFEDTMAFWKTLFFFFAFPTKEVSLNDLVEEVEISKTTANRVINVLEKEGFLKKEVLGKIWRISCNYGHHYNLSLKVPYHLALIHTSEDIFNKVYSITPNPRAIILFGSYRKGDDNERSDIDIAVEVIGNKELEILEIGKINMGYRKDVPVKLHIFSRNKIDLNLFANIANGIILDGFLEVRP